MANSIIKQRESGFESLWNSPNPSSGYTSGTITINNLAMYKAIVMVFKYRTNLDKMITSICPTILNKQVEVYCHFGTNLTCFRVYKVEPGTNKIAVGTESQTDGAGTGSDNTFLIPYAIYGLI